MPGSLRAVLLAFACLMVACGSGAASARDSGIRGRALLGPTCPVETVPPAPSCGPHPLATGIVLVRASDRKRVATTRSGRTGRFTFKVRPGRYYLESASKRRPFAKPVLVRVRAHRFTRATLFFDSGIR